MGYLNKVTSRTPRAIMKRLANFTLRFRIVFRVSFKKFPNRTPLCYLKPLHTWYYDNELKFLKNYSTSMFISSTKPSKSSKYSSSLTFEAMKLKNTHKMLSFSFNQTRVQTADAKGKDDVSKNWKGYGKNGLFIMIIWRPRSINRKLLSYSIGGAESRVQLDFYSLYE